MTTAPEHAAAVRPRDFALVVVGAVLWGTGGLAGAALADQGPSMPAVAALRLALGGGVLLLGLGIAARWRGGAGTAGLAAHGAGRATRRAGVARRVAATGVLAAAYQACYFLAVEATSVGVATLVALGAAPVLVATATAVGARRAPDARTLLAVGLGLAGLALLVGVGAGSAGSPAGVGLALVAAAAFATMTVLNRTSVPGLDPVLLTGASFTLGALLLVPLVVLAGPGGAPDGIGGWALVAYLGVGPTALAYAAYFAGLRGVPATTASLLALLEPLTAAVGAYLLRGETLGAAGLCGAGLLLAAVVVLRPRRAASPTMVGGLR